MLSFLNEILMSFDESDIFAFIGGVLFMIAWKNIRAVLWNKEHPRMRKLNLPKLNAKWFIYGFIVIAIVLSMASTYQIGQEQRRLAVATQQCQREFNTALKARSDLNARNEVLRQRDRDALATFVFHLVNVPPDIAALPQGDPGKTAYFGSETETYLKEIVAVQDERNANAAELENHPLPEPTCGV